MPFSTGSRRGWTRSFRTRSARDYGEAYAVNPKALEQRITEMSLALD